MTLVSRSDWTSLTDLQSQPTFDPWLEHSVSRRLLNARPLRLDAGGHNFATYLTDRIVTDSNSGLIDRAMDRHVDWRASVMRRRAVHCPTSNGKSQRHRLRRPSSQSALRSPSQDSVPFT
ncbi:unnamed protein product [Protopolystoma xenopodis]|uniref:Uncharacterized protein n=1 Tax=Protopolystoma xenopodis TaxID=117903 RepID=A0A448WSB3_9PLAT|nr:unnamed protein product [Protopolystoma xenopodis]